MFKVIPKVIRFSTTKSLLLYNALSEAMATVGAVSDIVKRGRKARCQANLGWSGSPSRINKMFVHTMGILIRSFIVS